MQLWTNARWRRCSAIVILVEKTGALSDVPRHTVCRPQCCLAAAVVAWQLQVVVALHVPSGLEMTTRRHTGSTAIVILSSIVYAARSHNAS